MYFAIAFLAYYLISNLYVAFAMTAEEMKEEFVTDMGVLPRIFANSFYSLAWALKATKVLLGNRIKKMI